MSCKSKCNACCGPQGPPGPPGPTGAGSQWFVGHVCLTGLFDQTPSEGDFLLDPNTGFIYIFISGEWISTGTKLNPFNCDDVYNCLKSLPKIDNCHGKCSASMVLTDSNAVFCNNGNPITVTALVIADQIQVLPVGSFSNPEELGELLKTINWSWETAFSAYVYLIQLDILGPIEGTQSYISFSNGQSINLHLECYCPNIDQCLPCEDLTKDVKVLALKGCDLLWVDPDCLGITGVHGPTGTTGLTGLTGPTGPTGICTLEVIIEKLNEIPSVEETDCQYNGIINNTNCLDFLIDITGTYSIATALNSPANIVSGPIVFTNNNEYQMALNTLHITIIDNIMSVSDSPSPINVVYYFNNLGQVIASINLYPVKCCPTDVDETYQVLTKVDPKTGEIAWVPGNCIADCKIDIEKEICKLEQFKKYRCCLKFDTAAPFLGNNKQLYATPWQITELIIFGVDVTADYAGEIFCYLDLGKILADNGWEQVLPPNGSIYKYCQSQNTPFADTTSSIKLIDANNIVFYCESTEYDPNPPPNPPNPPNPPHDDFIVECVNELEHPIQLIYVTSSCNLMVGGPEILLDSFNECANLKFYAQNLFLIDCVFTSLNQANIDSPWKLKELVINGFSQTVLTTAFSTSTELGQILLDMGWTYEKMNVYSITQILDAPNIDSYVIIQKATDSSDDLNIPLTVQLKTACTHGATGPTGLNSDSCSNNNYNYNNYLDESTRLVLSKDEDGNYCWISPECLRHGPIKVLTCCTGCTGVKIEDIPDCPFVPKYDIELILRPCHIELIKLHFGNVGPYWLVGYTIEHDPSNPNPDLNPNSNPTFIQPLEKNIDEPLSLKTLAKALTELNLNWTANPIVNNITEDTEKVTMTITGVCYKIINLLINQQGETEPFNYSIAVNQIIEQPCPGIPEDSKLLLKTEDGYCFIDVDCLVPKLPPPFDINKELNELGECTEQPSYKIVIYLDDCDIEKLNDIFGIVVQLEILSYILVSTTNDSSENPIELHELIGANPTMDDVLAAFTSLGWTVTDAAARPVELSIVTKDLIQYVAINQVNSFPQFPPYSYLISANFIQTADCPSKDPTNMTLIRRPDGHICWSPICPIQCILGPMGPSGPSGPTGPEAEILGENLGGGEEIFAGMSGNTVQLRTIAEGENIEAQTVGNTIEIAVSNNFDWSDTIFSGVPGAQVQSTSSLTFNNGAILFTNIIEETTANNGVVIDTSNGGTAADAVTIKDGGAKFSNKVNAQNQTVNPLFLEYFNFGTVNVDWYRSPPSLLLLETTTVAYQRMGNIITLYIPPFANVHNNLIATESRIVGQTLSAILRPQTTKNFTYVYNDTFLSDTVPTSLIIQTDGQIIISSNLAGNAFPNTTFDGTTSSLSITYTIA